MAITAPHKQINFEGVDKITKTLLKNSQKRTKKEYEKENQE